TLQDRAMLAISASFFLDTSSNPALGTLAINGDASSPSNIAITRQSGTNQVQVTANGNPITIGGGANPSASGVNVISVNGGIGDDRIDLSGVDSTFTGLSAAGGRVGVSTGSGDDTIYGPNDLIPWNWLSAGPGANTIIGGSENCFYIFNPGEVA